MPMAKREPRSISPKRKASGPVVIPLVVIDDESSSPPGRLAPQPIGDIGGTTGSIVSESTGASRDRVVPKVQPGRISPHPPVAIDRNGSSNMTTPNTGSHRGNKKRGRPRLFMWVSILVCIGMVFILVENGIELQTATDMAPDVSFKGDGVGGNEKNPKMLGAGSEKTSSSNMMDDDLFAYSWSTVFGSSKESNGVGREKYRTREAASLARSPKKKRQSKNVKKQKQKLQPLPVIRYDDDKIPQGAAGSITHAADSLLCRDSVIDYVINATDLKDECDGLKKAFTKNCADDTEQSEKSIQRRHRRLQQRGGNPIMYMQHTIHRLTRSIQKWLGPKAAVFMAEDEILNVWEVAAIEVEQGWDVLYRADDIKVILQPIQDIYQDEPRLIEVSWEAATNYADIVDDDEGFLRHERLRVNSSLAERHLSQGNDEQMVDVDPAEEYDGNLVDGDSSASIDSPAKVKNKTSHTKDPSATKPLMNLALPTTVKHVSEKMLSETLMLQQDNKIMKAVQNQTNVTEAQADAAASSKAVADAADMLSNVLNDPSSVEARTCCTSILNVFHENCNVNEEEELSDSRLFVAVAVIAVCGLIKSLIRHFTIRWLPEAAGCILVGVTAGYWLTFYPHHDISFDGNWFLRIMVPPIVFEAALSIDKRSFNRHIIPILFYAVVGTLLATGLTAVIVHEGSLYFHGLCETIPYPEALAFGALISSIDPIAVLSVLSNMGMTDTDTIYVVIFGESLLNDGVAIVLFQTLVHFLDDNMEVDSHAVVAAAIHFMVVFIGSLLIGIGSGLCCTVFYWIMHGCQTPLVEVLMFCCWALLPYYVCDGIEWSGIVAVVAAGFIMDITVVGTHLKHRPLEGVYDAVLEGSNSGLSQDSAPDHSTNDKERRRRSGTIRRPIFSRDGLLSTEAKTHIGFVTEIIATMMETAIFAYLGLFLFSSRYHWNFYHVVISIGGCCISRAVMIPSLSFIANWITKIHQFRESCLSQRLPQQQVNGQGTPVNRPNKAAGVIIDRKMQLVLWFAGLRGAMSFALVEHIPQYDAVTGEGTRLKSELKAMTSASIIFTVFVLGGATFYMMEALGLTPNQQSKDNAFGGGGKPTLMEREMEMTRLLATNGLPEGKDNEEISSNSGEDYGELNENSTTGIYTSSTLGDHNTPRKPGRPGTFRRQRTIPDK